MTNARRARADWTAVALLVAVSSAVTTCRSLTWIALSQVWHGVAIVKN